MRESTCVCLTGRASVDQTHGRTLAQVHWAYDRRAVEEQPSCLVIRALPTLHMARMPICCDTVRLLASNPTRLCQVGEPVADEGGAADVEGLWHRPEQRAHRHALVVA